MSTTENEVPSRWRSRIKGYGDEDPEQLLANPNNWRTHPRRQQKALEQALDKVGWVQSVMVNTITGHVVDGHLRVALAISKDETRVPVTYVELTEDEERLVLASLDPITALAVTDSAQLVALIGGLDIEGELEALLHHEAGMRPAVHRTFSEDDISNRDQEMRDMYMKVQHQADDNIVDVICPDCGAEFGVAI